MAFRRDLDPPNPAYEASPATYRTICGHRLAPARRMRQTGCIPAGGGAADAPIGTDNERYIVGLVVIYMAA